MQEPARILIVEDNRDTMLTLGILLRSEGFWVHTHSTGKDVEEVVENFKPDIVLLDIGLPGVSGYEIARALRGRYKDQLPILVAVTAYSEPADKLEAQRSGIHHHVAKPYDPSRLLQLMTDLTRPGSRPATSSPT